MPASLTVALDVGAGDDRALEEQAPVEGRRLSSTRSVPP
jgi:hypothetical protein